jgi:acyl-CoA synthetase (AMP-forming)/AMP-acid ligase II
MTARDVVVNVLPLFHIHGLAFATHLTWLTGGTLLVEDAFEPRQTLAAIERGTVFMAVPPIYYRLLEDPQFRALAKTWQKVRLFTCGSAPIRPEVLPELEGILGQPVINRYGMTEAYVITSLPLAGPWPHGSVGLPSRACRCACATMEPRQQQGSWFRPCWRAKSVSPVLEQAGCTRSAKWLVRYGRLGRLDAAGF